MKRFNRYETNSIDGRLERLHKRKKALEEELSRVDSEYNTVLVEWRCLYGLENAGCSPSTPSADDCGADSGGRCLSALTRGPHSTGTAGKAGTTGVETGNLEHISELYRLCALAEEISAKYKETKEETTLASTQTSTPINQEANSVPINKRESPKNHPTQCRVE